MIMMRQGGRHLRSNGMKRGCCCSIDKCFLYTSTHLCGATDYEEYYRVQTDKTWDAWQSYCLRGAIYRDRFAYEVDEGSYQGFFYDIPLGSYDVCVARSGGRRDESTALPYDPELRFGDVDNVCVDLNRVIKYNETINWRCVEMNDVFDGLAAQLPSGLIGVEHDVIVKVEYFRHIQGKNEGGVFNFESGDIHFFIVEAYAYFK